jgi:hypothetical protein
MKFGPYHGPGCMIEHACHFKPPSCSRRTRRRELEAEVTSSETYSSGVPHKIA